MTDTLDIPAVILAAGKGTRLDPLTDHRPKPMLPVANRPLLEHVVESVASAGFTEIILVVGYQRERIQQHFGNGTDWNVNIRYAVQEPQRGTGHALLQAESYVGGSVLVLNGDRVVEPELLRNVATTHLNTETPTMAVTRHDEPSHHGVVEVRDGRIVDLEEKPPAATVSSNLINAGVYAIGPDFCAALRHADIGNELAITEPFRSGLDDSPVRAEPYEGRRLNVSYPWDLLAVNEALLTDTASDPSTTASIADTATVASRTAIGPGTTVQPGSVIQRGTSLSPNVAVGPNAVVRNAIVLSDITLDSSCIVRDTIIGSNTRIGPNATIGGGPADVALDEHMHRDVRLGAVIGDYAEIGANATLKPGTVLESDVTVEDGATVSGRIPEGTHVTTG